MYLRGDENIKKSVDWLTILIYIVLMFAGWISVYAASYEYDNSVSLFDLSGRAGYQLMWVLSSLMLCFILLKLDNNLFDVLAYYIYIFFMLLLVLTIFIAPEIKGSRSWIVLGPVSIQPAEFAKFAVALALAKYLDTYNLKLLAPKTLLTVSGIIILPILLILLQQETGSALVYLSFILVLYRVGLPSIILFLLVTAVVLFIVSLKYSEVSMGIISEGEFYSIILIIIISVLMVIYYTKDLIVTQNIVIGTSVIFGLAYLLSEFIEVNWGYVAVPTLLLLIGYFLFLAKKHWQRTYLLLAVFVVCSMGYVSSIDYLFQEVLQPHQQMRIKVSFGMEEDLRGAGYNVNQSKIAIGSGGLTGKGFLNGTQTKLKYVPEQDTDFIFCTVGEEHGFIGSIVVLLLFLTFIIRLIYLAERQKSIFGLVYGYCVAAIFFFHLVINIGMVIGLTPVIGIPLPFFSYGGSSIWAFTILLSIFLRIDMARKRR